MDGSGLGRVCSVGTMWRCMAARRAFPAAAVERSAARSSPHARQLGGLGVLQQERYGCRSTQRKATLHVRVAPSLRSSHMDNLVPAAMASRSEADQAPASAVSMLSKHGVGSVHVEMGWRDDVSVGAASEDGVMGCMKMCERE
eukprot:jgi/Ulvmu1/5519/UM023_0055.1